MLRRLSRPIRTVFRWQIIATCTLAIAAGLLEGVHGAGSAVAGGLVSILAGLAAALVASRSDTKSAGGVLIGALKAEGVKLGLMVLMLWAVVETYSAVVLPAFIGSFLVTALIFSMAFFVRERDLR